MKKKEYFLLSNCLWLERRRLYLYIKCQGVSLGSSLIIPCSPSHRTQPIYETSATSKLQVPTYLSLAFSTQVQLRWEYSSVQIQQTFQLKRLFFRSKVLVWFIKCPTIYICKISGKNLIFQNSYIQKRRKWILGNCFFCSCVLF